MEPSPVGDWLVEAELSTCSSSQIIPRSIYLSHQFFLPQTQGEPSRPHSHS